MSSATIVPVAQALYLCDGHLGSPGGKTDLMGLFNSIRAAHYPHMQTQFVVFAKLLQGLGQVSFYVDIRFAPTQQLTHVSSAHTLVFPDRDTVVEMALTRETIPEICLFSSTRIPIMTVYLRSMESLWGAHTWNCGWALPREASEVGCPRS